jgi:hypothetical protein
MTPENSTDMHIIVRTEEGHTLIAMPAWMLVYRLAFEDFRWPELVPSPEKGFSVEVVHKGTGQALLKRYCAADFAEPISDAAPDA